MTSATGQATIPRTTMAPSVVTLMRRMPQTMASIRSTKAQVDVSSVAMTSPDGRSVCHDVAQPDQVVVAVGDGAAERAQRGAPVEPAADAAEDRGGHQHERVGDDQRAEGLPQCPRARPRLRDAAQAARRRSAVPRRRWPACRARWRCRRRRTRRGRAASGASSTPGCPWSMHWERGCVHPWESPGGR